MIHAPTRRAPVKLVAASLAVALVLPLGGCVLSAEAEWAAGVEEYYTQAVEIAERFQEGDDAIIELADAATRGESIDDDDYAIGYSANETMTAAHTDWLNLVVGDPALHEPHLVIEEAMRDVRQADKELAIAIEEGHMSMVSDANAQREAGDQKIEEALEEMASWYADNERRIQRGLKNAE